MAKSQTTVRIGLIQHACPPNADSSSHLDKAVGMIRDAAGQGAQIITTQELFVSSYFPQVQDEQHFDLAESIPGPTSRTLCALADELKVTLIASLFEKRSAGVYHNTAILIDDGEIVGKYRKMHIPDDPRFYEKYYFTPGDLDFTACSTRLADIGMLICWDQWFPEAARLTVMRGAQIIFYPTAIGWHHSETPEDRARQLDAWMTVQRAHAIANGVFVAAVNRVGQEDELTFWGSSFIADPTGAIIRQADGCKEQILIADCDLSMIEHQQRAWPFMRDRRIDAYGGLTKRYLDD